MTRSIDLSDVEAQARAQMMILRWNNHGATDITSPGHYYDMTIRVVGVDYNKFGLKFTVQRTSISTIINYSGDVEREMHVSFSEVQDPESMKESLAEVLYPYFEKRTI